MSSDAMTKISMQGKIKMASSTEKWQDTLTMKYKGKGVNTKLTSELIEDDANQ